MHEVGDTRLRICPRCRMPVEAEDGMFVCARREEHRFCEACRDAAPHLGLCPVCGGRAVPARGVLG